jgi:hypothetical protein
MRANARLIAAAPDLLEAAEAMLRRIDNTDGMTGALYRSHLGADADRLRAAIDKARERVTSLNRRSDG